MSGVCMFSIFMHETLSVIEGLLSMQDYIYYPSINNEAEIFPESPRDLLKAAQLCFPELEFKCKADSSCTNDSLLCLSAGRS